ncbi:OTU domain-containing protein 5-A [Heterodontus francisci]|uniref:OTU domain-containing protein 5-A n=1 Tax=Heterodontus francisci TaxID=7792 RepID=UPI00355BCDD5
MTILPKQQPERPDESERQAGSRPRASPTPPPQAPAPPAPPPSPASGQAPAPASHWLQDGGGGGPGPSHGHSKRRHRASPHRSGRKSHRPGLHLHPHLQHHLHHHHHHRHRLGLGPLAGGPPPPALPSAQAVAAGAGLGAAAGGGLGAAGGLPASGSPGPEEPGAGYNSEDEYETASREQLQDPAQVEQQEHWFEKALSEKKGFVIKRMKEDGACLFRAVADQVYGDQDMHDVVRKHCMDYLVKNADYFSNYVTEDFTTYINRKRMSSCHGNHIEMQAMAEMYNRPVEVYQYSVAGEENLEPINTFHGIHQTEDEPIRVSYHRNIHYNSVVNPNKATIGVGLGLPAFKPGSADQSLMKNAIKTSEESWIEQQMLEDKKRATDWEATNEAIEEQVARESYLQWLRDQEKQARQNDFCGRGQWNAGCVLSTEAGIKPATEEEEVIQSFEPSTASQSHHVICISAPSTSFAPDKNLAISVLKFPSSGVLSRSPSHGGSCVHLRAHTDLHQSNLSEETAAEALGDLIIVLAIKVPAVSQWVPFLAHSQELDVRVP